jgi:hypothetical protein
MLHVPQIVTIMFSLNLKVHLLKCTVLNLIYLLCVKMKKKNHYMFKR